MCIKLFSVHQLFLITFPCHSYAKLYYEIVYVLSVQGFQL